MENFESPTIGNFFFQQVACWNSHIGVPSCLKWAPRRAMFAAASSVLTFWIPNDSNAEPTRMDTEAGVEAEHPSQ